MGTEMNNLISANGADTNYFLRFIPSSSHRTKDGNVPGISSLDLVDVVLGLQHHKLPRGLKWTEYPFIQSPIYEQWNQLCYLRGRNSMGSLSSLDIESVSQEQAFFVYDETSADTRIEPGILSRYRRSAAHHYKKFFPGKPIYARFKGEDEYKLVELEQLEAPGAGFEFYEYNYRVNFTAIGCKAIDYVIMKYDCMPKIPKPDDSMPYAQRLKLQNAISLQDGYTYNRFTFLSEPYGLQTLFVLRKATEEERKQLFNFFQVYPPPRNGPKMTFGGAVKNGRWIGSGKYMQKPDLQKEIGWALHDAAAFGLVDLKTNDEVSLTDAGHALLDIMHTDNDDPDAFLRFMDPTTLSMHADQVGRIEAWMTRFFRKMKVKVDKLPRL